MKRQTCCEVHGMKDGCRQGRDCPEREIHPPGWGHPIVLMFAAGVIVLCTGIVLAAKWIGK